MSVGGGGNRVTIAAHVLVNARILGGDGRDTLRGGSGDDLIRGGGDADSLSGGAGNDRLEGGGGDASLAGGAGNDIEVGGDGNDRFGQEASANGADLLAGGGGVDTLSYSARTAPVAVSVDGRADDGDVAAAEFDNVQPSIERMSGGRAGDVLVGSSGADRLSGGPGDDILRGGRGRDVLLGGEGLDQIASRDLSGDLVDCGPGRDSVAADRLDATAGDCETVRRTVSMRLGRRSSTLSRSGVLPFAVTCSPTAFGDCTGSVVVNTSRRVRTRSGVRRLRLAARRFVVAPGETMVLNLRFRRRSRAFVRRARLVPVRASLANARDAAGPSRRAARVFRLRPSP